MELLEGKPDQLLYRPINPFNCTSRQRGWVGRLVKVTKYQLLDFTEYGSRWAGWVEELHQYVPCAELRSLSNYV